MNFIDNHSDLDTVNYLSKSVQPEVLEKALNRTGLVKKEIINKNGKRQTVYIRPDEIQATPTPRAVPKEKKKPEKRPTVEATPFAITEKTKHLVNLTEVKELPDHIKALTIPPDWRNVMISLDPEADVLAVGKDSQNRPQYLYSQKHWDEAKAKKFSRIQNLIENKPQLVEIIEKMDDRESADCLNLILQMGLRPGSTKDTKSKVEALGATTLRGENVIEEDGQISLRFTGKDGVYQDHVVPNEELAKMLYQRKQKAGDKGDLFNTTDAKLRDKLHPLGITTKDLRTMLATETAHEWLSDVEPVTDVKEFTKIRNLVGDAVCSKLGNQRSMSLNSYIDPSTFENWSPEGYKNWKASEQQKQTKKEME